MTSKHTGESVFAAMAAELLAKSIDNEILKNCISRDNYEQWRKQYTWDALTN